jgi:hypothetical protein
MGLRGDVVRLCDLPLNDGFGLRAPRVDTVNREARR